MTFVVITLSFGVIGALSNGAWSSAAFGTIGVILFSAARQHKF
jgi:hypothetical protein